MNDVLEPTESPAAPLLRYLLASLADWLDDPATEECDAVASIGRMRHRMLFATCMRLAPVLSAAGPTDFSPAAPPARKAHGAFVAFSRARTATACLLFTA